MKKKFLLLILLCILINCKSNIDVIDQKKTNRILVNKKVCIALPIELKYALGEDEIKKIILNYDNKNVDISYIFLGDSINDKEKNLNDKTNTNIYR